MKAEVKRQERGCESDLFTSAFEQAPAADADKALGSASRFGAFKVWAMLEYRQCGADRTDLVFQTYRYLHYTGRTGKTITHARALPY
ncbi:hypothetical protein KCP76_09980 [Salmonella enterica subsp. enterica serovar Weltevreden]|nr:hypothetical protein KCP76_09980 [Salmonella enterica subsp. enterica serovar Weltevreden]